MSKYSYPSEKFSQAIRTLIGSRSIQERLISAFTPLSLIDPGTLPEELQGEFEDMMRELTKESDPTGEGTSVVTINKMNDEEASRYAERIFNFYWKTEAAYQRQLGPEE